MGVVVAMGYDLLNTKLCERAGISCAVLFMYEISMKYMLIVLLYVLFVVSRTKVVPLVLC